MAKDPSGLPGARIVASNLRFLQLTEALANELTRQRIPYMLLKGAAYLDTLYEDLRLRPMMDIDVLVPRKHQLRVNRAAVRLGLQFQSPPPTHTGAWADHYNWQYKSEDGALIEVHFGLCPMGQFQIDYPGLWARRVIRRSEYRDVPMLSSEDSLLHAAIHEAKHAYQVCGKSREDIRRIIELWSPDWNVVLQRAEAWGCRAALFLTLREAQKHGAQIPEAVIDQLQPRAGRRLALRALFDTEAEIQPRVPSLPRWFKLAAALSLADSSRQRGEFLLQYASRRSRDFLATRRR